MEKCNCGSKCEDLRVKLARVECKLDIIDEKIVSWTDDGSEVFSCGNEFATFNSTDVDKSKDELSDLEELADAVGKYVAKKTNEKQPFGRLLMEEDSSNGAWVIFDRKGNEFVIPSILAGSELLEVIESDEFVKGIHKTFNVYGFIINDVGSNIEIIAREKMDRVRSVNVNEGGICVENFEKNLGVKARVIVKRSSNNNYIEGLEKALNFKYGSSIIIE